LNKQWLFQLANDIEAKHGKEKRDLIFGNLEDMQENLNYLSDWFKNFTSGMDSLNDKDFLQELMTNRCPCGFGEEDCKPMRDFYDNSTTLAEFVESYRNWLYDKYNGDIDEMELRGNVLYMTKPLGGWSVTGSCGKGCHCWLAKNAEDTISDIFCYCCTIGHTGRPFQVAFGDNIKMEFVESIVCGGERCVMAIHLPAKEVNLCKHGFNMYCRMLAAPTGFEVVHEEGFSYVTGDMLSPTMVIYDLKVKKNHHEVAQKMARLIEARRISNWLELVKDDALFEALKGNGFTITQQDSMMIKDMSDFASDFASDDLIDIFVVQNSDELVHWIEINCACFGALYSEKQWAEIHALRNVTLYLAKFNGVPASSMLIITDGSACIELLHTLLDYRNKGIASIMIKRALAELKRDGVSKVTVQTGAIDLFAKIGFTVVCEKYVASI
jgi:GNAT superfamily N-acetyltransferase